MNLDSTWTYGILANPYFKGLFYNSVFSIKKKGGLENANKVFSSFNNCFNAGQEFYYSDKYIK